MELGKPRVDTGGHGWGWGAGPHECGWHGLAARAVWRLSLISPNGAAPYQPRAKRSDALGGIAIGNPALKGRSIARATRGTGPPLQGFVATTTPTQGDALGWNGTAPLGLNGCRRLAGRSGCDAVVVQARRNTSESPAIPPGQWPGGTGVSPVPPGDGDIYGLWSAVTCHRFIEATGRRRLARGVRLQEGRSRLAPAVACGRERKGTEVRRRQVACAKAVTSHRTPNGGGAALRA